MARGGCATRDRRSRPAQHVDLNQLATVALGTVAVADPDRRTRRPQLRVTDRAGGELMLLYDVWRDTDRLAAVLLEAAGRSGATLDADTRRGLEQLAAGRRAR